MSNIGELVRRKRIVRGWTKKGLAERAGISPSMVLRIENGERPNPSVPVLCSLADALGIPRDDIFRLVGYKKDDRDLPMIERLFPDLKSEKQQETAQKIIDGLARNNDLEDGDYDRLVEHMEMFFNHVKSKINPI